MSPLCARVSNGFLVLGYSLVFVVWPQIKKKREKNQREKTNRDSFREECRKFLPTKLIVALR